MSEKNTVNPHNTRPARSGTDASSTAAGSTAPDSTGAGSTNPGSTNAGTTAPGGTSAGSTSAAGAPVPLEQIEAQICELAGHLAAGTCRFLQLVAEFDARQGWASWQQPSCAAWLAWRCQVAPGTAREQVRVARALAGLPAITAEFAAGRMSYAKVRALTRIADADTDKDLAELCGAMTAAQYFWQLSVSGLSPRTAGSAISRMLTPGRPAGSGCTWLRTGR